MYRLNVASYPMFLVYTLSMHVHHNVWMYILYTTTNMMCEYSNTAYNIPHVFMYTLYTPCVSMYTFMEDYIQHIWMYTLYTLHNLHAIAFGLHIYRGYYKIFIYQWIAELWDIKGLFVTFHASLVDLYLISPLPIEIWVKKA